METNGYMMLGFTLVFAVIGLHLVSFVVRSSSLSRDLAMLSQINKKTPKKKPAPRKKQK